MVSPTTTREVLYVSATRGREANRLYVDTHYDPDPQTSHDQASEPVTAKEVLTGVLRNEGADVAAHDMIRRQPVRSRGHGAALGRIPDAGHACPARALGHPARPIRSERRRLDAVRASAAHGPLLAAFRDAEARGLDVEANFPRLVAGRSLADAADVAAVLHGRVERWTQAAGGRRQRTAGNFIAGLIPRARGVSDPELAQALAERDQAMEDRARTLAEEAIKSGHSWVQRIWEPAVRPCPAGPLGARSLDRRGLSGPLAHHREADDRKPERRREQRADQPTAPGPGRRNPCAGHQSRGSRRTSTSRLGAADRGGEGSRTVK